jgi:HPt (histidine-containing phosphotransfer) domain-containing protein
MGIMQGQQVFDRTSALASVGGDRQFLRELVGLVQAAWPAVLADIRKALEIGDLRAVGENARLAKAAAEYVSAKRAYDSALQLECMAGKANLLGIQRATSQLEEEVHKLQPVLSMFRCSEGSREAKYAST